MQRNRASGGSGVESNDFERLGWPTQLLRKLMFVDLPIKRKFLLLGVGTLFWFCVLSFTVSRQ
ncbi:MAG: hypothetical protein M1359_09850 [Betaproteobacteria bacterium]|jgi:hypothetical protein|uniref:hypothetical protein n=1 Tax=Serpentinimonas maccroryi TaxID=1458426 RepID=UPI002033F31D|nr:hypothetical protein [Serpentinimonas maccroryi]MCL5969518.1 hypothetical protein [Betaproteobacteria bacterium]MCM2478336.1 hypothetical protein [Serpentinimonas maccroryi]